MNTDIKIQKFYVRQDAISEIIAYALALLLIEDFTTLHVISGFFQYRRGFLYLI